MISEGNMDRKRSFCNEDFYGVSCKHPRPAEHAADQLYLPGEIFHYSEASQNHPYFGEVNCSKCHDQDNIANGSITEVKNEPERGDDTPVRLCSPLWTSGSVIQEDVKAEPAFHISVFPEFFEFEHGTMTYAQSDEIRSSVLSYHHQKLVPVGVDHQACVPEWGDQSIDTSHLVNGGSEYSAADFIDESEERLMGTCIIPMPDLEACKSNICTSEVQRNKCNCLDMGSISCIQQHVTEAREKLQESLGSKIFEDLGFGDMGEVVAEKWTDEEKQAFHDTILVYPASSGMNFWNHFSTTIPSRTKMELVSYYFNVFVLRKRAEQNRFDPMNIDSDDDEWERSDFGMSEEESDSGVESPADEDVACHSQGSYDRKSQEEIKDENELNYHQNLGATCVSSNKEGKRDADNQDDSCTSFEYNCDKAEPCNPTNVENNTGDFSYEYEYQCNQECNWRPFVHTHMHNLEEKLKCLDGEGFFDHLVLL